MLKDNLLSNSSRFVYQNVEKSSETQVQPETTSSYPDDLTKSESMERAVEDFFYAQIGLKAEKFKDFLTKMGEEGAIKLQFEKDSVSYWKDGNKYNIPAEFIRETKNFSDPEEIKKWLSKVGENGGRNLNFDKNGISYWYGANKYNIPAELLR